MSDNDELLCQLRPLLAERLFVDIDEVQLHSRLIVDLQVDSLDFVDLQFALEEKFGVRFGHGEFFEPTPKWVNKDGSLKDSAIDRLSVMMPDLPALAAKGPVSVVTFFHSVTVDTLVRLTLHQRQTSDVSSEGTTS